jgi:hypothetical protein
VCLLLALTAGLPGAGSVKAQDDVYIVASEKLFRWPSREGLRDLPPQRLAPLAGLTQIGSIAVNRLSAAYVNSGLDGAIHRTDGQAITLVHQSSAQVRQLAFGRSNEVLFFSTLNTPQSGGGLSDGAIHALNLVTGQAEVRHVVQQSTVDGRWWGAFTVDLDDRIFLGTFAGGIYELRNGTAQLVYRGPGHRIHSLAWGVNDLYYATGSSELYRMENFRNPEPAVELPGERVTHVSYAWFPLSDEINTEPCELRVSVTGADPALIAAYFPVLRGRNLRWIGTDTEASGGPIASGAFRYFVARGTYWVSMDTKADISAAPTPREVQVDCTTNKAEASFRF